MRRHRLNYDPRNGVDEVNPVKEAIENELRELCQTRANLDKAVTLFKVWWRLQIHRWGVPDYPKGIDWPTISSYVHMSTILQPLISTVGSGGGPGSTAHLSPRQAAPATPQEAKA